MAGGQAAVCEGGVLLRLEETDDWNRLTARLAHWTGLRRQCEEVGRCATDRVVYVVSQPIPGIR